MGKKPEVSTNEVQCLTPNQELSVQVNEMDTDEMPELLEIVDSAFLKLHETSSDDVLKVVQHLLSTISKQSPEKTVQQSE